MSSKDKNIRKSFTSSHPNSEFQFAKKNYKFAQYLSINMFLHIYIITKHYLYFNLKYF